MPKSKVFFDHSLENFRVELARQSHHTDFSLNCIYMVKVIVFIFTKYAQAIVQRDIYTTDSYKNILRCYVLIASWWRTSKNSLNDKGSRDSNKCLPGFLKLGSLSSYMDKIDKGKMRP